QDARAERAACGALREHERCGRVQLARRTAHHAGEETVLHQRALLREVTPPGVHPLEGAEREAVLAGFFQRVPARFQRGERLGGLHLLDSRSAHGATDERSLYTALYSGRQSGLI